MSHVEHCLHAYRWNNDDNSKPPILPIPILLPPFLLHPFPLPQLPTFPPTTPVLLGVDLLAAPHPTRAVLLLEEKVAEVPLIRDLPLVLPLPAAAADLLPELLQLDPIRGRALDLALALVPDPLLLQQRIPEKVQTDVNVPILHRGDVDHLPLSSRRRKRVVRVEGKISFILIERDWQLDNLGIMQETTEMDPRI